MEKIPPRRARLLAGLPLFLILLAFAGATSAATPRSLQLELDRLHSGKSEKLTTRQVHHLLVSRAPIVYPLEARVKRITGSGVFVGHVAPNGTVDQVWIGVSTGSALLDRVAVDGIKRWQFKQGHDFLFKEPLTFTLSGGFPSSR
jgi:TonB family protein